jgi:hypothetical protein
MTGLIAYWHYVCFRCQVLIEPGDEQPKVDPDGVTYYACPEHADDLDTP